MLASKGAPFKNVIKQTHISLVYACILKKKKRKMSTRAGKATCGKWGLILLLQQLIQDSLITTESQAGKYFVFEAGLKKAICKQCFHAFQCKGGSTFI